MGEYYGERTNLGRQFTAEVERGKKALSYDGQSLGEIHPEIQEIVETDTSSDDFGRIKHVGVAHNMALVGGQDEETTYNLDRRIARDYEWEFGQKEGPEVGRKVAHDYLITQGYSEPIKERTADILADQHSRMVNPVLALKDVVKKRRAKKDAKSLKSAR